MSFKEPTNIGKKYGYLVEKINTFIKDIEYIPDYIEIDLQEDDETHKQLLAIRKAINVYYKIMNGEQDSDSSEQDSDSSEQESEKDSSEQESEKDSSEQESEKDSSEQESEKDSGELDTDSTQSDVSIDCQSCPSKDVCHSCCGACKLTNIENKEQDEESFNLDLQK